MYRYIQEVVPVLSQDVQIHPRSGPSFEPGCTDTSKKWSQFCPRMYRYIQEIQFCPRMYRYIQEIQFCPRMYRYILEIQSCPRMYIGGFRVEWYISTTSWSETLDIYVRIIHQIFLLPLLTGGIPLCTNQKVTYLLCKYSWGSTRCHTVAGDSYRK